MGVWLAERETDPAMIRRTPAQRNGDVGGLGHDHVSQHQVRSG